MAISRPIFEYWNARVSAFGRRAALSLRHSDDEYQAVTDAHKRETFPHLKRALRGTERLVLDFGCGPGRFTGDLAKAVAGRAIGLDPMEGFLKLAPRGGDVAYVRAASDMMPLPDACIGVVWIYLVLGGIDGGALDAIAPEILRVLTDGGLLFIAEETARDRSQRRLYTADGGPDQDAYWFVRTVDDYKRIFARAPLTEVHTYRDVDHHVSVMTGKKAA